MRSKFVSIEPVAVLLFGVCWIAPQWLYADQNSDYQNCVNTYIMSQNTCNLSQNGIDTQASATYTAKLTSDNLAEGTQINQDAQTQVVQQSACNITLWGSIGNPSIQNDVGSCGLANINQDAAANASFAIQSANCNANNSDHAKLAACLCPLNSTLKFTIAQDKATSTKCASDAQAQHDASCIPLSDAVRAQADALALAAQTLADKTAQAICAQTTTVEDQDTAPVCLYNAQAIYNNCMNGVDCNYNPPSSSMECCLDNAASAYNTTLASIFSGWASTVGPANGQYQHDIIMCDANAANSDALANATFGSSEANNNITYNMAMAMALDVEQMSLTSDANQCAKDQADCTCNNPTDQNELKICNAAAAVKQSQNDKVATTLYNSIAAGSMAVPPGSAYTAKYNQNQRDNTKLQSDLQSDRDGDTACTAETHSTFDTIYNAQTALYNANNAAALQAYHAQIQACNPTGQGGGNG